MESSNRQVRWRLLLTPPKDGPWNMAIDHALMDRARSSGETVFRVYSWSRPVLSLGRNQRALNVYVDSELERRGLEVVRRPTGGRALLHHREITYSVTAPSGRDTLNASFRRINALLINALHAIGVPAEGAIAKGREPAPSGLPCFAQPSTGEIVVGGRKLIGSAQWRDAGALLQHGSIIVDDDQGIIPSVMRDPIFAPPPASLRELLGRAPSPSELADAFLDAIRSSEDAHVSILAHSDLSQLAVSSKVAFYQDDAWTWRR